jgi:hypothetical protein
MPTGTTIECVGHFDNSSNNPRKPEASKTVRFGDRNWDEDDGSDILKLSWSKLTSRDLVLP